MYLTGSAVRGRHLDGQQARSGPACFEVCVQPLLHSLLGFGTTKRKAGELGTSADRLEDEWSDIQYVVLDEVSMVGAKFLYETSARLQSIFASDPERAGLPFGGVNMLFFGDLGQLASPRARPTSKVCEPKSSVSQCREISYFTPFSCECKSISTWIFPFGLPRIDGSTSGGVSLDRHLESVTVCSLFSSTTSRHPHDKLESLCFTCKLV